LLEFWKSQNAYDGYSSLPFEEPAFTQPGAASTARNVGTT
jgi:hypothetical protein